MENCEYTTLHHNEYGYVIQCRNCTGFQVAFGNIMLHLQTEEYKALSDYLWLLHSNHSETEEPEVKKILVPTDSRKVTMVFSVLETERFYDLLQQAKLMQQVYHTLENKN